MHDARYRMAERGIRAEPLQPEWCALRPGELCHMVSAPADYEVNVTDYLRMLEVMLAPTTLWLNMKSSIIYVMQKNAANSRIFGLYAEGPLRTSTLPHFDRYLTCLLCHISFT